MALCGSGGGYPPGATIAASIVQLVPCDDACRLCIIAMRAGARPAVAYSQLRRGAGDAAMGGIFHALSRGCFGQESLVHAELNPRIRVGYQRHRVAAVIKS